MEEERFLTTAEVCERLCKTPQGLDYMVAAGKLKKFKQGASRDNFYLEKDIDELLKFREAA